MTASRHYAGGKTLRFRFDRVGNVARTNPEAGLAVCSFVGIVHCAGRRLLRIGRRIAPSQIVRNLKMPLLNLVLVLIVVGVALHLINRYVPMASSIKTILNVVVVVVVCVWLLQSTGMWGNLSTYRIGR